MNVANLLEQRAKEYGKKTAIVFRQEEISFAQLKDKVFLTKGFDWES